MTKVLASTTNGILLSINNDIYAVSFYPSTKNGESPETLINRAILKEMMSKYQDKHL